jgi:ABC-type tungstate transport system substrate-binding protein
MRIMKVMVIVVNSLKISDNCIFILQVGLVMRKVLQWRRELSMWFLYVKTEAILGQVFP